MKTIVIVSVVLAILSIILPICMALNTPLVVSLSDNNTTDNFSSDSSSYNTPSDISSSPTFDSEHSVRLLVDGEITDLPLHDYLIGAVAAEMPASFEPEALCAQAVAIRTYVLHAELVVPSSAHPDADVCSDSTCCLAWKSDEALKEKWGNDYDKYLQKITSAVETTDGIYISYSDEPALAAFHSSSAGQTESSSAVWSQAVPYLVSVSTPESSDNVPNYVSSVTISLSDFKDTVTESFPNAQFSDDPSKWLGTKVYTAGGRISSVVIGGVSVSGTKLRSMFSLRSTAMSIELSDDSFIITTTGYGHGVGMSQYGANVMAGDGSDYTEILTWYYPGTELKNAADLFS